MKPLIAFLITGLLSGCQNQIINYDDGIIATGQMPNLVKDGNNDLHLIYGNGDSILYTYSSDYGKTFSDPSLISVIPKLAASHMRGPQIAVTSTGLVLTACNTMGNIFSFVKEGSGNWTPSLRVNDVDTVARENFIALSADGQNVFAVWLDLRDKHNKIFGAKSSDAGKTWRKNMLIYASPDTTVCECCKPAVVIRGENVSVMFRNWLGGNRDLYLIQSKDGGVNFGEAKKLGTGTWALNGCPMDGGAIALNKDGEVQTVWNRKGTIYSDEPGKEEKELGKGRNCTMESVNGKNAYAWVENGEVVILKPQGIKKTLGKGHLPVIETINNEHIICVWELDEQIHKALVEL